MQVSYHFKSWNEDDISKSNKIEASQEIDSRKITQVKTQWLTEKRVLQILIQQSVLTLLFLFRYSQFLGIHNSHLKSGGGKHIGIPRNSQQDSQEFLGIPRNSYEIPRNSYFKTLKGIGTQNGTSRMTFFLPRLFSLNFDRKFQKLEIKAGNM